MYAWVKNLVSKQTCFRLSLAVFFVLTTFQLSTVWGIDCGPKYSPSGQIQKIEAKDFTLNITVEDPRDDKEKFFFLWAMGWKSWDPDATKFNRGQKLFLTSKPKDIVKESLLDSFVIAGYKVADQTGDITLRFKLNKFLYILDTWKYGPIGFAEIALKVLVEKNGQCRFTKEFYNRSQKPFDAFRQVEDAEPVLSRCLSKIVEDVAMDGDLRLAISGTRHETAAKVSSVIAESGVNTHTPKPDFVIRVVKGLPHRFPEGEVKGLWLSSVPMKLDVFAFPKDFNGKFSVFKSWETNGTNRGYYLGKTPLLAKLKNGAYEILFVHPPIKDKNYKPRYRTRYHKVLRSQVREQVYPFIAPRDGSLYAVEGTYYWTQEIEVTVEDDFSTAMVLFQREDQTTSDMLKGLPSEENFKFSSADSLRDPNKLFDTSFALTDKEARQAELMLKRSGIWAKKYGDHQTLTIEVKPNNIDVFRAISLVSDKELESLEQTRGTVLTKPNPTQIQAQKLSVTDVPTTQLTFKPTLDSDSKDTRDSILIDSLSQDNQDKGFQKQSGMGQTSFDKEIQILREKANEGDIEAQYELGLAYYIGPRNYKERESKAYKEHKEDYNKEAIKWWKKAAEQGHIKAQCTLGALYFQGLDEITKDYKESTKWYMKAAEQGDKDAQYNLGAHYEYGQGVVKDLNEAYKWYKKAAGKEHVDAEYRLGMMYYKGQGVIQNYKFAMKWYKKAAEKGHGKAQSELATMYCENQGVVQDYNKAVIWYRRAANIRLVVIPLYGLGAFYYVEEGDIQACYKLGQAYQSGHGVVKDLNEAYKWYKKAAEKGDKQAQFELANKYFNGEGVNQDYIEAYKWYILSSKQDCIEAIQAKEKIKNEMTSENISEAEKRAANFKIAGNKYNSSEYFFDVRPGEIKTRTYRELTDEDIAEAKRKGFSLPTIPVFEPPKIDIPKIPDFKPPKFEIPKIPTFEPPKFNIPKIEPPKITQIEPYMGRTKSPGTQPTTRIPGNILDEAIKMLPDFKEELKGENPVRVRNPNKFSVTAGIRSGELGKNLFIPANGVQTMYVPNGRYDIYFVYSNKPNALFQGNSITLSNNGVEIQIVQVVNGNYNIRQIK